jgi:hypothetical protein
VPYGCHGGFAYVGGVVVTLGIYYSAAISGRCKVGISPDRAECGLSWEIVGRVPRLSGWGGK